MGASDGVDSATWADPPSFVRKKKIARAQFGEEGARDPAASWGAGQLPFWLRRAGTRWTVSSFSLEGGPGGFLFPGGRWLAIPGRPAAH